MDFNGRGRLVSPRCWSCYSSTPLPVATLFFTRQAGRASHCDALHGSSRSRQVRLSSAIRHNPIQARLGKVSQVCCCRPCSPPRKVASAKPIGRANQQLRLVRPWLALSPSPRSPRQQGIFFVGAPNAVGATQHASLRGRAPANSRSSGPPPGSQVTEGAIGH